MQIFILLIIYVVVFQVNAWRPGRKISRWQIEDAQKQGPNVCIVETIQGVNYTYYTDCKYWKPRQICGKQAFIKYDCCSGYRRVPGQLGCVGVKPLSDLINTAYNVGARKFAKLIEYLGLAHDLSQGSAVTLFAPSDESLDEYLESRGVRFEWLYDNIEEYRNLVVGHLVDKRLPSTHWISDSLIDTKLEDYKLRINKYSNGIETVNCQLIVRKNQLATNGIVHVIEGVLDPTSFQNTNIFDIIKKTNGFTTFLQILQNSGLTEKLRFSDNIYTIFAPTDEAFSKISQSHLSAILEDNVLSNALIAHHVVPYPVCLSSLISDYNTRNLQREKLVFNCDYQGVKIENVQLSDNHIEGTNGLLYAFDEVLFPDIAKTMLDLAKDEELQAFLQIIRAAELEETLTQMKHYTMFAPTDLAIHAWSTRKLAELQINKDMAKKFVLNHIVMGQYSTEEICSNQVVTSLEQKYPLRFQVYRDNFGIENALIEKSDKKASNGILHVISHVLHPAIISLDEVLRNDGNFSIWLQAMDRVKQYHPFTYQELKRHDSACTYFVPSDDAFRRLGNTQLDKFMKNDDYLTKIMKNHVAENMILSESFKNNLQYDVATMQDTLNVIRQQDRVLVNDATLEKYDLFNENGVAHSIDTVLLPDELGCPYNSQMGSNNCNRV